MPPRRKPSAPHRIHREFNLVVRLRTLASRRHWCWAALALAMVLGRILLLPLLPVPQPSVPDEFSYLLAGDTFAHGRMANPTPAYPEFFESAHILVQPRYVSKYPPGQGSVLALGQRLFGHPYWGVVLSTAAMIFLFCWAADAWLPPQWTLVAGALAWILFFVRHYWFTSYWGGSLAACGGALVLGGLGHFLRFRLPQARFSLAVGAAILWFTRPYEGGVLCAAALIVLAIRFVKLPGLKRAMVLRQVAMPSLVVLLAAGSLAAWYNLRTTGRVIQMPYFLHMRQYDAAPTLWILPPSSLKNYSSVNLREAHEWGRTIYDREHLRPLHVQLAVQFVLMLTGAVWMQFLAFGFLLFGLPWARLGGRKKWLVLLLAAGVATMMPETYTLPHYAAPYTAAVLIAIVASMRALWYRMAASRLRGPIFVSALAVMATFLFLDYLAVLQTPRTTPRATLIHQLSVQGGRHLVLVDYAAGWSPWVSGNWADGEWVYNGADLGAGTVLFAHLRSDRENLQLLNAYPGRAAWILRLGPELSAAHLEPYVSPLPEPASARISPVEATSRRP